MAMQIIDVEQSSPEWFYARMGMPTASEFSTCMASGKGGAESKTRTTYLRKLAGEVITRCPSESFTNIHLERGKEMESEARDWYCEQRGPTIKPERIGFVINGPKGCSPDSFIGSDGMLEIKTQLPHLLIGTLRADQFPPEHLAQCQGGLWVCEREWIDIAVYWPLMPMFIKRIYRDESYIQKISDAVDRFNEDLAKEVDFIRSYGQRRAAA